MRRGHGARPCEKMSAAIRVFLQDCPAYATYKKMDTRPKLQFQRTLVHTLLDAAGIAALILTVVLVAASWRGLPDRVPHHFDFSGQPDVWGGKWVLLLLPAFSLVLYVFLGFIRAMPHRFNYLWPITEQNAERQYRIAMSMLTLLRLEVVLLFGYLNWVMIQCARGGVASLGSLFAPIIVVVLLVTIVAHIVAAGRAR